VTKANEPFYFRLGGVVKLIERLGGDWDQTVHLKSDWIEQ
jgi:hypothetical protein